jgi:hypothetical protein
MPEIRAAAHALARTLAAGPSDPASAGTATAPAADAVGQPRGGRIVTLARHNDMAIGEFAGT